MWRKKELTKSVRTITKKATCKVFIFGYFAHSNEQRFIKLNIKLVKNKENFHKISFKKKRLNFTLDRTLLRDHKTQTVNFVGDSSSIYTHFWWHFWEQSLFIIDLNVESVHFLSNLIPFFCQQLRALCYLHRFCDGKNHIEVILERCDLYENHMIQFQWKNQAVAKRQWFESFPLKRLMPNCRWRMSSLYSFSLCFTDYVFFALSMNWNLRCGKLVKFYCRRFWYLKYNGFWLVWLRVFSIRHSVFWFLLSGMHI